MSSPFSSLDSVCCSATSLSNLERFLHFVTPTVASRILPQSCLNDINTLWQPLGKDTTEYFTLKDLWEWFNEWSAYGAGTPVGLENGETVMQYYVPYLSAIQIYSDKSVAASRVRREDTEIVEFESDSWSDDSGSDNISRSLSNNSSKSWDAVSEDSNCDHEGSWPRDGLGYLYLQYTEMSPPYWRVPLMDKITELARSYPALMTLKNVDLSPASWMAIAWYPIYSIPSQKNERDLAACFLTFHTLSSSFEDCAMEYNNINIGKDICCSESMGSLGGEKCEIKNSGFISLPPFGLATYKMQGDLWLNIDSSSDHERLADMYRAADSWLKQLNFHHHDFNFFTYHSSL
ncbi:uncharacterized protein LOC129293902 isoform X1 [Prosopis cineraria]|uniref:uncharacterized protein LOC129293902 isoform X1 n=1 Tax=Prosopis cineraria TaxID=364024 RepID=UPI00240ECA22|nr:uncharacterized protein LOC129293902 isoform X1 [Prosopis cineraria]